MTSAMFLLPCPVRSCTQLYSRELKNQQLAPLVGPVKLLLIQKLRLIGQLADQTPARHTKLQIVSLTIAIPSLLAASDFFIDCSSDTQVRLQLVAVPFHL